jgi:phosphoribosyl 1,2-cyclic phosphate phosphodiesterase
MSEVQLHALGTGTSQGIPVIGCNCSTCQSTDPFDQRFRSSVVFSSGGTNVLIDTGPDLRQQLLRSELSSIDSVALTHAHQDHTAGLDDLRPLIFKSGRPMPIHCRAEVAARLREQYAYIFDNPNYPGVPKIEILPLQGDHLTIAGLDFTLIHALHGDLPVVGFRLGAISYLTDANKITDAELEKVRGSRYFILNALRDEPHYSHFHLDAAIDVGKRSGAEEVLFTHISHHFEPHAALSKRLPKGFGLLRDRHLLKA